MLLKCKYGLSSNLVTIRIDGKSHSRMWQRNSITYIHLISMLIRLTVALKKLHSWLQWQLGFVTEYCVGSILMTHFWLPTASQVTSYSDLKPVPSPWESLRQSWDLFEDGGNNAGECNRVRLWVSKHCNQLQQGWGQKDNLNLLSYLRKQVVWIGCIRVGSWLENDACFGGWFWSRKGEIKLQIVNLPANFREHLFVPRWHEDGGMGSHRVLPILPFYPAYEECATVEGW